MLDMGFIHDDIKKIMEQTAINQDKPYFFSATMATSDNNLANTILTSPTAG